MAAAMASDNMIRLDSDGFSSSYSYRWARRSQKEQYEELSDDLKMAELSARMAVAATRLMQEESKRRSRERMVPEHVTRLSQYLETVIQSEAETSEPETLARASKHLSQNKLKPPEPPAAESEPPGFATTPHCQAIVTLAILGNMLALTLETDYPAWPYWDFVNVGFLLFFIVELLLYLRFRSFEDVFWTGADWAWRLYCLLTVVIGIIDTIIACIFRRNMTARQIGPGETEFDILMGRPDAIPVWQLLSVRGLMLTRLLRLYRIVSMDVRLTKFVTLLGSMLGTFAWILTIILVMILVLSVLLTRLLGFVTTDDRDFREVLKRFDDIPTSLFTLFQLTTMDDWSTIALPMTGWNPAWRLFFIAFITFMSWTMLSLLTAVASECFIAEAKSQKHVEELQSQVHRQDFTRFICGEFIRADKDANGLLDKNEFLELMSQPRLVSEMEKQGVNLNMRDLNATWDSFDLDDSGELTIDELVDGFSFLMENLATKHLTGVEHALKRFSRRVEVNVGPLADRIQNAGERHKEATRKLIKRGELHTRIFEDPALIRQAVRSSVLESKGPLVINVESEARRAKFGLGSSGSAIGSRSTLMSRMESLLLK
mmetsp:Transcript_27038/g.58864  ORF Transcript_27038/g.58864 Transcript_27038/m.58864 type:complete len:601 (+) Transcript_27038:563-2365(+)